MINKRLHLPVVLFVFLVKTSEIKILFILVFENHLSKFQLLLDTTSLFSSI